MPIMPVGRHFGSTCVGSALQKAGTGTLQIVLSWTNEQGEHINSYHFVTEGAWGYAEELLTKLGWVPAEHDYDLSQLNLSPSPLDGVKAAVYVKEEPGKDGAPPRLKAMVFADNGPQLMDPAEARKTADDFRLKLRAWSGKSSVPKPSKAPSRPAAPDDDDDVPF